MYKISGNGIKRLSDGAIFPAVAGNKDWQEYQKWLDAGNTPEAEFTLDEVKSKMIIAVKRTAALKIDGVLPDWQTRRHREQIDVGVLTTFTQSDYTVKQQICQAIRDASNTIEAAIQASSEPESIDVVNHTAWPV